MSDEHLLRIARIEAMRAVNNDRMEVPKMLLRDFWNVTIAIVWLVVHNTRIE